MSYHTSVFNAPAAGVNAVNTDAVFNDGGILRGQNNHLILTAPFRLLATALVGVSVVRGRWQVPKWNFYGEPSIFSCNRALQPPTNPQWDAWYEQGPMLPQNQEIALQISNNLGAATEIENGVVQLGSPDWNRQTEPSLFPFWTRATVAITPTLNAWSGAQNLALVQGLLGGTYGVRRVIVQGTNAVAFRMIFARPRVYAGYPLRPGDLIQTAVGDVLNNQTNVWTSPWGRLGYFSTLELPQIEVFGTLAGAITYQVFMLLDYLSEDVNAIDQYVRGYNQ